MPLPPYKRDELARHIEAQNAVNKAINDASAQMVAYLEQFVGKKVLTKDEIFTKKVKDGLPQLPNKHDLIVWMSASRYFISIEGKANVQSSSGIAVYAESYVNIADVTDMCLVKLREPTKFKTDFDIDLVMVSIDKAKEAQIIADLLRGRCGPFGKYIAYCDTNGN